MSDTFFVATCKGLTGRALGSKILKVETEVPEELSELLPSDRRVCIEYPGNISFLDCGRLSRTIETWESREHFSSHIYFQGLLGTNSNGQQALHVTACVQLIELVNRQSRMTYSLS